MEAKQLADQKAAAEAAQQLAAQKAAAEAQRVAEQKAAAEAQRLADQKAAMEAKQLADQKAAAEAAQQLAAQKAAAEAQRVAEQKAAAEAQRLADQKAAMEAKQLADQKAAAEAAQQLAAQKAAAEAQRVAEQKAAAEAQRLADQKAAMEAKQLADQKAAAEAAQRLRRKRLPPRRRGLADQKAAMEAKQLADQKAAAEAAQRFAAQRPPRRKDWPIRKQRWRQNSSQIRKPRPKQRNNSQRKRLPPRRRGLRSKRQPPRRKDWPIRKQRWRQNSSQIRKPRPKQRNDSQRKKLPPRRRGLRSKRQPPRRKDWPISKAAMEAKQLADQKAAAEAAQRLAAQKAAAEAVVVLPSSPTQAAAPQPAPVQAAAKPSTTMPDSQPPPSPTTLALAGSPLPGTFATRTSPVPPPTAFTPTTPVGLPEARNLALDVPCALIDIRESKSPGQPARLLVSGPTLPGPAFDSFVRRVEAAGRAVSIATEPLDPGHCAALEGLGDMVRRSRERSPLRLIAPTAPVLVGDQLVITSEAIPGGALYVDLYAADGTVLHLRRGKVSDKLADNHLTIAATAPGPAGKRLLVAITTAVPLNLARRPTIESETTYLPVLQHELARLGDASVGPRAEVASYRSSRHQDRSRSRHDRCKLPLARVARRTRVTRDVRTSLRASRWEKRFPPQTARSFKPAANDDRVVHLWTPVLCRQKVLVQIIRPPICCPLRIRLREPPSSTSRFPVLNASVLADMNAERIAKLPRVD